MRGGNAVAARAEEGFELTGKPAPLGLLLRDLWRSRDLITMLAKKDFVARYRRASLGMAWAVGLPLVQAVVLAVVISHIARFQTKVNLATFVYTGTLAWNFFSGTLGATSTSIVDGSGLATKIYFPRPVLPLVVVASNLFAFLPGLPLLLIMGLVFRTHLGVHTLLLIPAVLVMIAFTTAVSLVAAALHVYFRDMRYIVQAILLPWFWASAVFYPLPLLHGSLLKVVDLNPATGMILLFRAAIVGGDAGWTATLWWPFVWTGVLLIIAAELYRRFDRVFVDLL
jgi:ABC-type polysaccharide/polyol phosphate export permease